MCSSNAEKKILSKTHKCVTFYCKFTRHGFLQDINNILTILNAHKMCCILYSV